MACEVLPQGRCKSVFPDIQTLAGKEDHQINIVVKSTDGDIILDHQINTCNGWVAGVKFLYKTVNERAQSATSPYKKNTYDHNFELGHPSKSIPHATTKAMGIQVTGAFKPCEGCALRKAKQ